MSERIVDEAFAAELADNRGGSGDERFSRLSELLRSGEESGVSAALSLLLEIVRDQAGRIAGLEERLHQVYLKSGESLAQLAHDLSSESEPLSRETALEQVRKAASELQENMRAELKLTRGDVFARSDLQLKHAEDRMDALEHDSARAAESMAKKLDDLKERLEQTFAKLRDAGI